MMLYRRGKIWWVSQWDKNQQKQVRLSTGETDKDAAQRKAMQLLAPLLLTRDADLVENAATTVRKLRKQAKQATAAGIKLKDCWEKSPHVGKFGRALKESTINEAHRIWKAFVRYASEEKCQVLEDVTREIIDGFLASRGHRSRIVCFHVCRAMFNRLGVESNPFHQRPVADAEKSVHREPLSPEQISALLQEADRLAAAPVGKSSVDAAEFAVFIRFLLYTGLRLGDAATAKLEQIDFNAGIMERTMTKTGRKVRFPLHQELMGLLNREGEYVFPHMAAKYLKRRDTLTRRFRLLFDKVDIKGEPHQFCAHALRTTFASICAEQSIPLATIQSWLGHTSPSITRIYARVEDMRQKRAAMAKFPTLG